MSVWRQPTLQGTSCATGLPTHPGDIEVVSGEMMIPADGLLVIVWDAVAAADAELGIYVDNQFGSAESLVSYLQWGSAGHGRESVAEAAGLWTAGTFLPARLPIRRSP